MRVFRGVDFANNKKNRGLAFLSDDGKKLHWGETSAKSIDLTAVDCPLGTTEGFESLLSGNSPDDVNNDNFQARQTELWARARFTKSQAKTHGLAFHPTSHIQPTVALRIVPGALEWTYQELQPGGTSAQRLEAIKAARRGEGSIIEAHPRMFLYSALDRLVRHGLSIEPSDVLAFGQYKSSNKENKERANQNRATVYCILRDHLQWQGKEKRSISPNSPPGELINDDHAFDAWLCALTAWAHSLGETLSWQQAGIERSTVEIEGHFLVLS